MTATYLDKIMETKRDEVTLQKKRPITALQQMSLYNRTPLSFKKAITNAANNIGIIAEFKRRSPSLGVINDVAVITEVAKGYLQAGVAGMSILTDTNYFGGSLEDLSLVRNTSPTLPLLRKDFICDAYQIHQAKAYGADMILLIAACLTHSEIEELTHLAHSLELEVLLEIHNANELDKVPIFVDLVGVNNRNLKTFEVSLDTSRELYQKLPHSQIKISESGIYSAKEIHELSKLGFHGFLIGERFMKEENPSQACKAFFSTL